MTATERDKLIQERTEVEQRTKGAFVNPADLRRLNEITSLLLSDGRSDEIRLVVGKMRKSKRVTPFTRDRR